MTATAQTSAGDDVFTTADEERIEAELTEHLRPANEADSPTRLFGMLSPDALRKYQRYMKVESLKQLFSKRVLLGLGVLGVLLSQRGLVRKSN